MGEQAQSAEEVRAQIRDETRSSLAEDSETNLPVVDADAAAGLHDLSPIAGTVLEHYWVRKPFAHVAVVEDENGDRQYVRVEPAMDDLERDLRQDIATTIRERLLDAGLDRDGTDWETFDRHVTTILRDEGEGLSPATLRKLQYYFRRDFRRFGLIDPFMSDPNIEDVSCDGTDVPVYVYHAAYGNLETNVAFGADQLDSLAVKLAQRTGRHLSASRPLMTETLPDGSRLQVTLGSDIAARGSNFTIRKFREEPFTPVELIAYGTFSLAEMAYLWLAIEHNRSVLYVGPTASGKTTSMNATTMFIPPDNKVVSIEETREINLPHGNWIADVTREADVSQDRPPVDTYQLLSEALHQRPDHILVGEIRTDPSVVRTFFQAIGTGHAGFTTFHARSARDTLRRLRHDPLSVPDELLTDIDVISVQRLLSVDDERVRRSYGLTELRTSEADGTELHEVFSYDPVRDEIDQVAESRVLRDVAHELGWSDERVREELRQRQRVLADLLASDTTGYETVTDRLFRFARNPETALPETTPETDLSRIAIADDS
jgi:flagellar protein FlaI